MISLIAWIAIGILAISHWLQVYKIHKHKEVRDISIWTYVFLLIGYCCLLLKSTTDWQAGTGDAVWVFRQIATIFPVTVILFQIRYHQKDIWHDDDDSYCDGCSEELEPHWSFCPYCSVERRE